MLATTHQAPEEQITMSAKSKKERRRRRAAIQNPDEILQSGGVRIARFGRKVILENTATAEEIEQRKEERKSLIPELRARVDRHIDAVRGLLNRYDPLALIASLAAFTQFDNLDKLTPDDEREINLAELEYAISLALANRLESSPQQAGVEQIGEFFDELVALRRELTLFYLSLVQSEEEKYTHAEATLRFSMIIWSLFERGESFRQVSESINVRLFSSSSALLRKHFGFDYSSIAAFARRIMTVIRDRFQGMIDRGHGYSMLVDRELFGIDPENDEERRILEVMAIGFGDNDVFMSIDGSLGWPLSPTLVRQRPFIVCDGRYYVPAMIALFHSLREATESLLERADAAYYEKRYLEDRGAYLGDECVRLMSEWFGSDRVFGSAYYPSADGKKRYELDCLVVYGDAIVLIEAKAGALTPAARRGGVKRLMRDLEKLVEDAHEQALRALQYVDSGRPAIFYRKNGKELARVDRRRIRHVFLINVTLDSLGPIGPSLARYGIVNEGRADPHLLWSVALADLMVIRDILESPNVFLHYLMRRKEVFKRPVIDAVDELDLLMNYVVDGLYFEDRDVENMAEYLVAGYTDALDAYFVHREHGVTAEKPGVRLPEKLQDFVGALDRCPDKAGVSVAAFLLNGDHESRVKVAEQIEMLEDRMLSEGGGRSMTIVAEAQICTICCFSRMISVDDAQRGAIKQLADFTAAQIVLVVSYVPPLIAGRIRTWAFPR